MFKKLKDKIAEEVKQTSLKSVQQLAQAVVSPSSSSVFEPSSNNEHFCIDDEDAQETPKNSPARSGGFTSVDLLGSAGAPSPAHDRLPSRRSSVSSVNSDASSLFPIFESTHNFHLQSDIESASEIEDVSSQLERYNKEMLYAAYRRMQQRYVKYKNRYAELTMHYKELEREKNKARTVLSETQDKALRRISELREQCQLEQKAKAHLEEALRNDLEERDHIINTLNTKIGLLKSGGSTSGTDSNINKSTDNLIDLSNDTASNKSTDETADAALRERAKKMEVLLGKMKAALIDKNHKIDDLKKQLQEAQDTTYKHENGDGDGLGEVSATVEELKATIKSKDDLLEMLNKEKHNFEIKIQELEHMLKLKMDELATLSKNETESINKLKEKLTMISNQLRDEATEKSELKRDLSNKNEQIAVLTDKIEHTSEESVTLKAKIKTLENDIIQLQEKLISGVNETTYLEEIINEIKDNTNNLDNTVKSKDNGLTCVDSPLKEKLKTLRETFVDKFREQNHELQKLQQNMLTEKENFVVKIQLLEDTLASKDMEIINKEKALAELNAYMYDTNLKVDDLESLSEKLSYQGEEINKKEMRILELESKLCELELVIEGLQNDLTQSNKEIELNSVSMDELKAKLIIKESELLEKIKSHKKEIEDKDKELQSISVLQQKYEEKVNLLNQQLAEINSRYENTQRDLTSTREALNNNEDILGENYSLKSTVRELENECAILKQQISNIVLNRDTEMNNLKAVCEERQREIEHCRTTNEHLEEQLTLKNNSFNELSSQLNQKINESVVKIKNLEEEICEKNQALETLSEEHRSKNQELKVNIKKNEEVIQELTARNEEFEQDKKKYETKCKEFQCSIQTYEKQIQDLESKNHEYERLNYKLESHKKELQQHVDKCKKDILNLQEKFDAVCSKNTSLETELEKLRFYEEERKNNENQSSVEFENLQKKCHSVTQELKNLQETLQDRNVLIDNMTQEICVYKESIKNLEYQVNESNSVCEKALKDKQIFSSFLEQCLNSLKELKLQHNDLIGFVHRNSKNVNENLAESKNKIWKHCNCVIENILKQIEMDGKNVAEEIRDAHEKHGTEVEKLNTQIKQLQDDLNNSKDKLRNQEINTNQITRLQDEILILKEVNQELQNTLNSSESKHELKIKKLQETVDNLENVKNKYEKSNKKIEELVLYLLPLETPDEPFESKLNKLIPALKKLNTELITEQNKLKSVEENIALHQNEIKKLGNELNEKNKVLDFRESELKTLREKHGLLENNVLELKTLHTEEINSLQEKYNKNLNDKLLELAEHMKSSNESKTCEQCEALRSSNINLRETIYKLNERINTLSDDLQEQDIFSNRDHDSRMETMLHENEQLKAKLEEYEDNHASQIKGLVNDFEKQLAIKDEEYSLLQNKEFDRRQEEDDYRINEMREQVVNLRQELESNSDEYESLMEKYKDLLKTKESDLASQKITHDKEMREQDKKWRACLDRRLAEEEARHKEEIIELTKEWNSERKDNSISKKQTVTEEIVQEEVEQELEVASQLATAAVESGTGSLDMMRRQLTAMTHQMNELQRRHRLEVAELQRLLMIRNHKKGKITTDCTIEDCTEMEYLRNILYEYMMGKEPVVLAKVLSAIVKFDANQTRNVLVKEEQKVSLLGQLGII